jgi:formate/nitrite transporter
MTPSHEAPHVSDLDPGVGLDALPPAAMARRAAAVGVEKAGMDAGRTLALAVLAGAFVALGGVFATTALTGTAGVPWGPARVLAGVAFSLGLMLVVVGGAELFTGNALIVMAWAGRRVSTRALLRNWLLVFAGNFAGAAATAVMVWLAGVHHMAAGGFGATALGIARAKVELGFAQAVALGILGNALVCLAVWLTLSARTTTDRIVAVVPPVSAFVAAGFEHSVANMYFVPFGLLVARLEPGFAASQARAVDHLTWGAFLAGNLVPVALGNVIGGAGLVAAVYWFVYLRRPADRNPPAPS